MRAFHQLKPARMKAISQLMSAVIGQITKLISTTMRHHLLSLVVCGADMGQRKKSISASGPEISTHVSVIRGFPLGLSCRLTNCITAHFCKNVYICMHDFDSSLVTNIK